jgi:hypothetical protein
MNPQLTTTETMRSNVQFFVATEQVSRTLNRERPVPQVDHGVEVVDNIGMDPAERDRQDSLAFLHRLVMD